jgi:hypothetical protein
MKLLSTWISKFYKTQHNVSGYVYGSFQEVMYMALVGIILSFEEHAILILILKNNHQVYCKREQVSYHPTIAHIPII